MRSLKALLQLTTRTPRVTGHVMHSFFPIGASSQTRKKPRQQLPAYRGYATHPYPPEFNWDKEFNGCQFPREQDYALGLSRLPAGLTFSALNPAFLATSISDTAELYRMIGTEECNHPIKRHFQQLIVFTPERRMLHSLAANLTATVCIYDDEHFIKLCNTLYPEVIARYNEKQIILAHEYERCQDEARQFMNQYLYQYDDANPLHRQLKFIEHEMRSRIGKQENPQDNARLFNALTILMKNKIYSERVYPHIDEAVINTIGKRLTVCPTIQIPDDVRESDQLWALPVKSASERNNQIIVGGPATGKSVYVAEFAARYKKETGKSGLMITAKLNVDTKRRLIELDDVVLPSHCKHSHNLHLKKSWGALSHMEASIMNRLAMDIIQQRLVREHQAPEMLHETTFPDEETINLFLQSKKLSFYLTHYAPCKAVDGNISRFKDTDRFVPIEVVLGSQKRMSMMLSELVKKSAHNSISIEHHDTQAIIHDEHNANAAIGLIDMQEHHYTIYNVQKTLELIKASHINHHATHRNQIFANDSRITPASLTKQFIDIYKNFTLIFACHLKVDPQEKNGPGKTSKVYATFSQHDGLQIHDMELLTKMKEECLYAKDLFEELRTKGVAPQQLISCQVR